MSKDQMTQSVEREKLDREGSNPFSTSLALPHISLSSTQQSNTTSKLYIVAQLKSTECVTDNLLYGLNF